MKQHNTKKRPVKSMDFKKKNMIQHESMINLGKKQRPCPDNSSNDYYIGGSQEKNILISEHFTLSTCMRRACAHITVTGHKSHVSLGAILAYI